MSHRGFEFEVPEIRLYPVDIRSNYDWWGRGRGMYKTYFQEESVPVDGRGEGSVGSMEESNGQSQDCGVGKNERKGRGTVKEC